MGEPLTPYNFPVSCDIIRSMKNKDLLLKLLMENENDFFKDENLRYFNMFTERVIRLQEMVSGQREYVAQLRDLMQAQLEYLPLIRLLFDEVSPIPVKAALALMGRIENTLRLPLCPLDADKEEQLRRALKRVGLIG